MKLLVLLLVVIGVLWLLRQRGGADAAAPSPSDGGKTSALPQPVLPCSHCGVHLPRSEAVPGLQGMYCSAAHRSASGDRA